MAAIVSKKDGEVLCGATIIDANYALTAAHCINTPGKYASDLELLVGEHDYKNRKEIIHLILGTLFAIRHRILTLIKVVFCFCFHYRAFVLFALWLNSFFLPSIIAYHLNLM